MVVNTKQPSAGSNTNHIPVLSCTNNASFGAPQSGARVYMPEKRPTPSNSKVPGRVAVQSAPRELNQLGHRVVEGGATTVACTVSRLWALVDHAPLLMDPSRPQSRRTWPTRQTTLFVGLVRTVQCKLSDGGAVSYCAWAHRTPGVQTTCW